MFFGKSCNFIAVGTKHHLINDSCFKKFEFFKQVDVFNISDAMKLDYSFDVRCDEDSEVRIDISRYDIKSCIIVCDWSF